MTRSGSERTDHSHGASSRSNSRSLCGLRVDSSSERSRVEGGDNGSGVEGGDDGPRLDGGGDGSRATVQPAASATARSCNSRSDAIPDAASASS